MKKPGLANSILIGLLIGVLLVPPTSQAQWTVFDPAQFELQVSKKVEEAVRWIEHYEKLAQQLSTLGGILKTAEGLLINDENEIRTMSQIGQAVRGGYQLGKQLEAVVIGRMQALKSIRQRMSNGIFDADADLRDFEEYLKRSIGRNSENAIATIERLRRMDNQLNRLYEELETARLGRAEAEIQKITAKDQIDAINAKAEPDRCPSCIASLEVKMGQCDQLIGQYDAEISRLENAIEERTKKYNVMLEQRTRMAQEVVTVDQAWKDLNKAKDQIQILLRRINDNQTDGAGE